MNDIDIKIKEWLLSLKKDEFVSKDFLQSKAIDWRVIDSYGFYHKLLSELLSWFDNREISEILEVQTSSDVIAIAKEDIDKTIEKWVIKLEVIVDEDPSLKDENKYNLVFCIESVFNDLFGWYQNTDLYLRYKEAYDRIEVDLQQI